MRRNDAEDPYPYAPCSYRPCRDIAPTPPMHLPAMLLRAMPLPAMPLQRPPSHGADDGGATSAAQTRPVRIGQRRARKGGADRVVQTCRSLCASKRDSQCERQRTGNGRGNPACPYEIVRCMFSRVKSALCYNPLP
jgi:hypothetical protein